jgi:hypothetical protein
MSDILTLIHEAVDNIQTSACVDCVQHAEELQKYDFEKETVRNDMLEKVIVNLESLATLQLVDLSPSVPTTSLTCHQKCLHHFN